ncbi:DNA-methyltransferase [Rhizobium leucaenae]|uniref:DNA-methyltransferase n=1 Tax=Rhizobium leucaenae TaxID=29450 RepID=UPI0007EE595E|nr:DNA methyltransferase [Rhizobium leucaenae]
MEPTAIVGGARLFHADCRDVLRSLPDNSIDSVVTDPPYALVSIVKRFGGANSKPAKGNEAYQRVSAGFMGKQWDTGEVAFSDEFWAEVLRVLKPGGHVVAFSGTRTYHRMAVAIEDAGFEIRDQLGWLYGSGFPKSHNQHGDWEGWGSALKPAWEPIALARKPLEGTIASNLAKWGVGAINVDGCRVNSGAVEKHVRTDNVTDASSMSGVSTGSTGSGEFLAGRWPANIIHDGSDEVLAAFPDTGPSKAANRGVTGRHDPGQGAEHNRMKGYSASVRGHDDNGGSAARFFYCAKASRADRDEGLEGFEKKRTGGMSATADGSMLTGSGNERTTSRANTHPTVKPTSLMQWLCRLVTPPGGTILDPFMGSGSTGKAALLEGFQFIGCEREDEYMPIAEARIQWAVDEVQRPVAARAQPAAKTTAAKKSPVSDNDNQPADLFSLSTPTTLAGAA